MEVTFTGHSGYKCQYHIVWIPKYRRHILKPGVAAYLRKSIPGILRRMPGVEVVELNILEDHIHLLASIPPKYAVASVVGELKQDTARLMRAKFDWLKKVYWKEQLVWSPGYFVSTVGLNETQILNYVRYQQKQDSGQMKFDLN